MFTGLIREIAKVKSFDKKSLKIKAKYRPNIGDSIAINGACLSVTRIYEDGFEVEVSDETREVVALENYKDKVADNILGKKRIILSYFLNKPWELPVFKGI